jgi:hypothetical protein
MFSIIRRYRGLLALGLLVVVPLTAGLPTRPAAAAAAAPLTSEDWKNFSYTSTCFSSTSQRFVARNGLAVTNHIHFQVYTPIYGDLTGDGKPEAIVPYSCTGADFGGVHLYVYTGTAAQPKLLGEIPSPKAPYSGSISSVTAVTLPIAIMGNAAQELLLQVSGVGYSANATHTCPDLSITVRYRVRAGTLRVVSSTTHHSSSCLNASKTPSVSSS